MDNLVEQNYDYSVFTDLMSIHSLTLGIAVLTGTVLFISGIYTFRSNAINAQAYPIRKAILLVLVGVALLSFPTFFSSVSQTLTGTPGTEINANSPNQMLAYNNAINLNVSNHVNDVFNHRIMQQLILFLIVAGTVIFFIGLYKLKNVGEMNNQSNLYAALAMMVSGSGLINIKWTVCSAASFGINLLGMSNTLC